MSESVRVLYIDDDPALVRLVQKRLGRKGFVVEHAGDIAQGLARVDEAQIDVLILDFNHSGEYERNAPVPSMSMDRSSKSTHRLAQ